MALPFLSQESTATHLPGSVPLSSERQSPESPSKSFEAGEIAVFGGTSSIGKSVVHWELQIPENTSYDGWALFVPGFGGIYDSSTAPVTAMAQEGIASLRYEPARRGDSLWNDLTKPQQLHTEGLGAITRDVLERLDARSTLVGRGIDVDKQLLVAHSMGLLAALLRANASPDTTHMVQSKAGCGLGHPTLPELACNVPRGALAGLRHEVLPSILQRDIPASRSALAGLYNYLRAPRLLSEGLSCLALNLIPLADKLRDKGVTLTHEAYQHDILVVPDPKIADYVDHYNEMPDAGHLAPIRKATKVAQSTTDSLALAA